jgi:hypothetical protein
MKRFSWMFLLVLAMGSANWALAQVSTPVPGPSTASGMVPGVDPRVSEVNGRLMEQGARIKEGVQTGKLTKETAKPLWEQVKAIRTQEKGFFATNGKRELTDEQVTQLNQSLDANSKAIFAAKHPDAAQAASTTAAPATSTGNPDSDPTN